MRRPPPKKSYKNFLNLKKKKKIFESFTFGSIWQAHPETRGWDISSFLDLKILGFYKSFKDYVL
jgi:hypothetical protein